MFCINLGYSKNPAEFDHSGGISGKQGPIPIAKSGAPRRLLGFNLRKSNAEFNGIAMVFQG